jgi:hypothetical protein
MRGRIPRVRQGMENGAHPLDSAAGIPYPHIGRDTPVPSKGEERGVPSREEGPLSPGSGGNGRGGGESICSENHYKPSDEIFTHGRRSGGDTSRR